MLSAKDFNLFLPFPASRSHVLCHMVAAGGSDACCNRQRRMAAVHGFCTPSTWALYCKYMALVLQVHRLCTAAGSADGHKKGIRSAAHAFSFYGTKNMSVPYLYSLLPYTPIIHFTSSSTVGIVMKRMPMKSMITPDFIIFVIGMYPLA